MSGERRFSYYRKKKCRFFETPGLLSTFPVVYVSAGHGPGKKRLIIISSRDVSQVSSLFLYSTYVFRRWRFGAELRGNDIKMNT